jgi:hypothetical protein
VKVYVVEGYPEDAEDFTDWKVLSIHATLDGAKASQPGANWVELDRDHDVDVWSNVNVNTPHRQILGYEVVQ